MVDVLGPIATAHESTQARVALAWLLSKVAVTAVIVGARRRTQLDDNLAAVDLVLTTEELNRLDEVSALPPEYPGWMMSAMSADRLCQIELWDDVGTGRED